MAHALEPAPHHALWLERVRATVEQPGGRLLLVAPPGAAKSTYISFVLPLWFLGNHPDRAVLAVTSSDTMAHQFHSTVQLGLASNPAHGAVFPERACRPDPGRGWSTDGLYLQGVPAGTKDPWYRCSGFGASVIGSRAHCLLLDDPVTQETATSQVEMQRVRQLLDMTLLPRLHPDGAALCITTRWGEDDVAAHLLKQGWDLLHTPALGDFPWLSGDAPRDEEGRGSLWPAQWSLEWLLHERRRLGGAQWSTVWMGDPVAVGAGLFRPEWLLPAAPRVPPGGGAPRHPGHLHRHRLEQQADGGLHRRRHARLLPPGAAAAPVRGGAVPQAGGRGGPARGAAGAPPGRAAGAGGGGGGGLPPGGHGGAGAAPAPAL